MLRLTALVLLLANLGYFAWSQGHLRALGWGPLDQREPQRLAQQVAPEKLRVEPPPGAAQPPDPPPAVAEATAPPSAPPSAPPESAPEAPAAPAAPATPAAAAADAPACYQAVGFTPAQAQALRVVMATLPWATGRWSLEEAVQSPRWIVYMGRFADNEALARKKAELRQLRIDFRDATGLMPGLALGTYSSEASAQQALSALAPKGIRTARVLQEREEQRSFTLHLPAATAAQRAEVESLNAAMAGRKLGPC